MNISYKRDMNHNYMILRCDENLDEESFETRMVFANKIPGLLSSHIRYIDGRTYMGYEVTGRQNLAVFCESRKPGKKEIQSILGSILTTIKGMEEYLLSPDHLILDPELVLMNFETQETALAFAPFYRKEIKSSLRELTEYLLAFLAHDDRQGIVLGYRFSHELTERNSGIPELMGILYGKDEESGPEAGAAPDEQKADEREDMMYQTELPPGPGSIDRTVPASEYEEVKGIGNGENEPGISDRDGREGRARARIRRENSSVRRTVFIIGIGFFAVVIGYLLVHFLLPSVSVPGDMTLRVAAAVLICAAACGAGIYARKRSRPDQEDSDRGAPAESIYDPEYRAQPRSRPHGESDLWEDCFDPDSEEGTPGSGIRMQDDNMTTLLTGGSEGYGMGAALIPEDAASGLPVIALSEREVLVGKQQGLVSFVIDSPAVSRIHARIRRREDGYYLRDLNSTNGTGVNGEAVFGNAERCLSDGDRVVFADTAYIFNS